MKNLRQFLKFDWERFAKDKDFMVNGISEYKDHDSGAHLGVKVETVITRDDTKYQSPKDGEIKTNRYEKVVFKVTKDVDVPIDAKVVAINAEAVVYGDYGNQISVTCDDIKVVDEARGKANA